MNQIRLHQNICAALVLAFFSFSLGGCGGEKLPDGMPKLHPTVITVIQDGSPLEGAAVALISADPSNSWSSTGLTDAAGKAEVRVQGTYAGAVPGKYYILITKSETDPSKLVAPNPDTDPQGYSRYMEESAKEVLNSYSLIDAKYGRISADAETLEVIAGKNEKTVDVGAAVRIARPATRR